MYIVPGAVQELPNAQSIMDRIRKGEARIQRNSEIKEALDAKVARHRNPWQSLTLNYGNQVRMCLCCYLRRANL